MFIECNILNDNRFTRSEETSYLIEVVDTDFKEIITAEIENSGINIVSPFIELYKSKNLNVPANLARLFKHFVKGFSLKEEYFWESLCEINKDFNSYKEEIQKYLILL